MIVLLSLGAHLCANNSHRLEFWPGQSDLATSSISLSVLTKLEVFFKWMQMITSKLRGMH